MAFALEKKTMPTPTPNHLNRALSLVIILSGMLGIIATDIYAPAIPHMILFFKTNSLSIQLSISLFLLGLSLSQLIAGSLSDRFGRKPILYFGCGLFLLATSFLIFTQNIFFFVAIRFMQGVGAGAIVVLSRVLLRDCMSATDMARQGSYLAAGIGLAPALAPIIGGYLSLHFGIYAIFIFLFVFIGLLCYLAIFHLAETNLHRSSNHPLYFYHHYFKVLKASVFWQHVIPTGTCLSAVILVATQNPLIAQKILGISLAHYTQAAGIAMLGLFFGMISNAQLLKQFSIEFTLRLGMMSMILIGFCFILISRMQHFVFFYLMLATFLLSFFSALILPNAGAQAFSPFGNIAGTVGALYGTIQMLTTAISTALFSYFIKNASIFSLGLGILILMGTCLFFYECLDRHKKIN